MKEMVLQVSGSFFQCLLWGVKMLDGKEPREGFIIFLNENIPGIVI